MTQSRRFSAFIDQIRNWTSAIKDKQYRSLSTGDLVSPSSSSKPSEFEPDFMEMDFGSTPTTSSLPAHFDDCDLVPMEFKKNGVKLLPQGSKQAEKAMKNHRKFGSSEELSKIKMEDIHKAQSWFFVDIDPRSAERILMSDGFREASFLISYFQQKYVMSIWRKNKVEHLVIRHYKKKNGSTGFMLDIDRSFKNLVELTEYYTKNKSYVLCTKLAKGVSRPRRNNNQDIRSRA
ncbi:hypothetical protein GCK72_010889 [Caenorhabditis remanei]|uniref:SH2 domain-containing protein n=2 Tax=Caenorhabditis remanei TaxID=31234 RepID=E3LWE0_CAERE|nr:hypothetical protein GCK72_010889 [Caenorhabditis remanei]EFO83704.1 hypothetical protein CRE_03069 [Caenorhabditis remanei]KAF1762627.1 hypothetical protein GCK72_010889 [Caenorhabditis remanei]